MMFPVWRKKIHPSPRSFMSSLYCSDPCLSCLEVQLVRCEDHAASCKAYYLYVKCESCLQAESVLNTLSHVEGAILGIAVNTFIALLLSQCITHHGYLFKCCSCPLQYWTEGVWGCFFCLGSFWFCFGLWLVFFFWLLSIAEKNEPVRS